jgi:thiol:disulfide interchange protein DsbD
MRYLVTYSYSFALFALTLFAMPDTRALAAAIPHGTVDLIAENQWIAPGRQNYLGLNFHLDKGWHIYWVNPGDSGQPPKVEWRLPTGITSGDIEWPAPRRLGSSPVVDYGYDYAVMLLVPLRSSSSLPTSPMAQLDGDLRVLVCREICVPGNAQISLTLPIKSMPPELDARSSGLFAGARKSLPRSAPPNWHFDLSEQKDAFVLTARIGRRAMRATFFPLEESQIDNSAPQKLVPEDAGFRLTLQKSDQLIKPIKRLKGVLEFSADKAYVIDVAVGAGNPGR